MDDSSSHEWESASGIMWEGQVARGCVEELHHAASCVSGRLAVALSFFILYLFGKVTDLDLFNTHTNTRTHTHNHTLAHTHTHVVR